MVAIIDYDAGNVRSVEKAVISLGAEALITRDPAEINRSDHVILPGVGAFGDAMGKLERYGLIPVIKEIAKSGKPFLGICLGEQLLFEKSEEAPGVEGLGILKGEVKKLSGADGLKVPNIGWNSLEIRNGGRLLDHIKNGTFVYFVHSYYVRAEDVSVVTATIDYGETVDAAVEKDNVFAVQFHPEKSSDDGIKILENFLNVH